MSLSHLKKLARRANELFPNNRYMCRQWFRTTYQLMSEGKHRLGPGNYVQKAH
jgi:hypothetical protein